MSQLRIDLGSLTRQASVAVVAFYQADAYVTSYFGWPQAVHEKVTAAIDATLPGVFND